MLRNEINTRLKPRVSDISKLNQTKSLYILFFLSGRMRLLKVLEAAIFSQELGLQYTNLLLFVLNHCNSSFFLDFTVEEVAFQHIQSAFFIICESLKTIAFNNLGEMAEVGIKDIR